MRKLYRGEVIRVMAPNGKGGLKERPVIVYKDAKKDDDVISVYCTGQNNGDDDFTIFIKFDSPEGVEMGLTKDTWIRPKNIIRIPTNSILRPIGRCSFMDKIESIIDKAKCGLF